MPTAQGTTPTQTIVIGNTIPARQFTFSVNDLPPTITSAFFAVKNPSGTRILRVECVVSGDVVTRPAIGAATTAAWPVGRLNWDIEVTIGGQEKTWVTGQFAMLTTAQ